MTDDAPTTDEGVEALDYVSKDGTPLPPGPSITDKLPKPKAAPWTPPDDPQQATMQERVADAHARWSAETGVDEPQDAEQSASLHKAVTDALR
jgi:hypothetical protein